MGELNCAVVPVPFAVPDTPSLPAKVVTTPFGRDFADGVVPGIGHEQISIRVRHHRRRIVEQRVGAGAVRRAADERLPGQRRHRILCVKHSI